MSRTKGQCNLCGKETKLIRSHILPEFLYKPLYDEKHRFMVINPNPEVSISRVQKGYTERLLCERCDNKLGRYEKYVKECIYDGEGVKGEWDGRYALLHGLDYKKTRLYYLSLLWRMSISSLRLFKAVSLGPHESRIQQMIYEENPGEPEQYGFFAIFPIIKGRFFEDLIVEPSWVRANGHRFYRAVIGGILYFFTTNSNAIHEKPRRALLQKNGEWMILTKEVESFPFLDQFFKAQSIASKQREKNEYHNSH